MKRSLISTTKILWKWVYWIQSLSLSTSWDLLRVMGSLIGPLREKKMKAMQVKKMETYTTRHCILSKPLLRKHIQQDIFYLKINFHFFFLDELHTQFSKSKQNSCISFLKLPHNYFFNSFGKKTITNKKKVKHFTDLMRYYYHPFDFKSIGQSIKTLHSAKKLDKAGVIFKKVEERRLLDIQFNKSTLTEIFWCRT